MSYAGFWKRFLAYIIDGFVLSIPVIFISIPIGIAMGVAEADEDAMNAVSVMLQLVSALIAWPYFALMESSAKQGTLGKMALGIKVTDRNGNRIGFGQATGRYFGKIISSLTCGIGYFLAGITSKKQALHDIMADCLVVDK
ncbi:MAG: RDD family protein [Arenimonas sp.]